MIFRTLIIDIANVILLINQEAIIAINFGFIPIAHIKLITMVSSKLFILNSMFTFQILSKDGKSLLIKKNEEY